MEIKRLKLRGFIGIKEGLGLDEVELDLSSINGLVAFDGPNGHGKTTILDNLHPYRTLASRSKSLQHHVFLRDSSKELIFTFQGDEYRTLIKIDSESERSEGFVWKNGEPMTNGKVSRYDSYIANLFGSQNLFFSSVFCAQNSEKISDLTTGQLKKLFSEFLRLDQLIEHEKTSNQAGNIISGKVETIEREIQELRGKLKDKDVVTQDLESKKNNLKKAENDLVITQEALKQNDDKLIKSRELLTENNHTLIKIKDLEIDRERLAIELGTDRLQVEKQLKEFREKLTGINSDIKDCEALLENECEIRNAAALEKKLSIQVDEKTNELDIVREELSKSTSELSVHSQALTKLTAYHASLVTDNKTLIIEGKIKARRDRMSALEKKARSCKSKTCSFIVGALEAQEQLPELQKKLAEQKAETAKLRTECEEKSNTINAEIDNIKKYAEAKARQRDDLSSNIVRLKNEIGKLKNLTDDLPKIEGASSKKTELKKQKEYVTSEGTKARDQWNSREEPKLQQIEQLRKKINELDKTVDDKISERIADIEDKIYDLNSEKASLEKVKSLIRIEIISLENDLESIELTEEKLKSLETKKQILLDHAADWRYLKDACSKDGLRALEIDSVAPVITGYANDLLINTFGPAHTVKFRTQDEETLREIFDILVIREDGSEVLLDDLSGGEKVWSLKALRLAMTLIAKEKSGKNFLTALADEEDGSLDVENARNFISLYRAFMKSGEFNTIYYISHKPDCVSMADHVLHFNNNGITIH